MENNIKRLLLKRAFAGYYVERRLVQQLNIYKDVILLYPEEKELADDLQQANEIAIAINNQAFGSYTKNTNQIWVNPMDLPFGKHWFQIQYIDFRSDSISYSLKSLRYFPGVELPTKTSNTDDQTEHQPITMDDVKGAIDSIIKHVVKNFNVDGFISVVRFFIILITTLFIGLFKMVFFTGDFSIKLMRELSLFIDASTPWFLGLLEFISKIIGGFYILIAMLWSGSTRKPNQNSRPDPYGRPAIEYQRRR